MEGEAQKKPNREYSALHAGGWQVFQVYNNIVYIENRARMSWDLIIKALNAWLKVISFQASVSDIERGHGSRYYSIYLHTSFLA